MRVSVVLDLVFFHTKAKSLAWGNVSEMTYFVLSGRKTKLNQSINQSISDMGTVSVNFVCQDFKISIVLHFPSAKTSRLFGCITVSNLARNKFA